MNGDKLSLSVPDGLPRADVSLTNRAGFIVSAGGGGDIAITAKDINIDNSSLNAGILRNFGSSGSQAGDVTLNATEAVTLVGSSVFNDVSAGGISNAGNMTIKTKQLTGTNGSQISASGTL
ncbi:MAG: hypothetical protein N4J56_007320 [Chroococcidiopsis sp. SAG 2025]|uniref:hypothetical protein n=1 Tax=Chroococcidiopsis sp. SAG 2025 TaxID=171389 RepID=UPI0029372E5E|nr:hypothetical protein [Chroococcidiopsis sp. SAG 2025]MDV2997615.1 hypothetical protein [Chroococcidiopsis sp. SAG 2025]